MRRMTVKQFFNKLNKLQTASDVADHIDAFLKANPKMRLMPFGGNSMNASTVGIASDSRRAFIEPVVNSEDAINELMVEQNPSWAKVSSPEELVVDKMGIDLENPSVAIRQALGLKEDIGANHTRLKIAEKYGAVVTRQKFDIPTAGMTRKEFCFAITDRGIGVDPDDMSNTILAYHRDNKISKPYTNGQFGQGALASLGFCKFNFIATRRQGSDRIGFTVVYLKEATSKQVQDTYVMIMDEEGNPLEIPVGAVTGEFPHGTKKMFFDYQKDGMHDLASKPNSIYTTLRAYLPDMPLPVYMDDKIGKNPAHTVLGTFKQLGAYVNEEDEKVEFSVGFTPIDIDDGQIEVRYFLLPSDADHKNWVSPGKPIIMTFHGQNQHEIESARSKIMEKAGLSQLEHHLLVQIKCDRLTRSQIRDLFATTREMVRKGQLYQQIRAEVIKLLGSDLRLKQIQEQRDREQSAKRVTGESWAEEAKKLGLLKDFTGTPDGTARGGHRGRQRTHTTHDGDKRRKSKRATTLAPTYINFVTTSDAVFPECGDRYPIHVETDAADVLDEYISVSISPLDKVGTGVTATRRSKLKNGRFVVYLDARSAAVDELGRVTIELDVPHQHKLDDTIEFLVKTPKPKGTRAKGNGSAQTLNQPPLPEFQPVDEDSDESLKHHLFGDNTEVTLVDVAVNAKVRDDSTGGQKVIIYYSTEFSSYTKWRLKSRKNRELFDNAYRHQLAYHFVANYDSEGNETISEDSWSQAARTFAIQAFREVKDK